MVTPILGDRLRLRPLQHCWSNNGDSHHSGGA
jgi:hypothetical protein